MNKSADVLNISTAVIVGKSATGYHIHDDVYYSSKIASLILFDLRFRHNMFK